MSKEDVWAIPELLRGSCPEPGSVHMVPSASIRTFETGANRNSDEGKYDYEGFLNPLVLERFGAYMHKHRHLADGTLRDSDNWQKGLPPVVCLKSLIRHVMDVWKHYRGGETIETPEDALCAIIFNAQSMLLTRLRRGKG